MPVSSPGSSFFGFTFVMFILCLSEGVSVGVGTGLVWECALVSSLGSSFFVLHLQCFFSECVSVGLGARLGVGVGVG